MKSNWSSRQRGFARTIRLDFFAANRSSTLSALNLMSLYTKSINSAFSGLSLILLIFAVLTSFSADLTLQATQTWLGWGGAGAAGHTHLGMLTLIRGDPGVHTLLSFILSIGGGGVRPVRPVVDTPVGSVLGWVTAWLLDCEAYPTHWMGCQIGRVVSLLGLGAMV